MSWRDLILEDTRRLGRTATNARPASPLWSRIVLIEDNSARAQRRVLAGVASRRAPGEVTIRIHRIQGGATCVLAEKSYRTGALLDEAPRGGRATVALQLLDGLRLRRQEMIVVAGPSYGCNRWFVAGLAERRYEYVVEIRPSTYLWNADVRNGKAARGIELLDHAKWGKLSVAVPGTIAPIPYAAADLARVLVPRSGVGRLFVAQTGGICGVHHGTVFALTSSRRAGLKQLLEAVGWARWIRPIVRRQERLALEAGARTKQRRATGGLRKNGAGLIVRANITLARRQDQRAVWCQAETSLRHYRSRRVFASQPGLNVVELFAGAGGMGLGFLLASPGRSRYRLVVSAEVNPIHVATLKRNHEVVRSIRRGVSDILPEEVQPLDLRASSSLDVIEARSKQAGGVHLLIGGPPCQGFSNANRNSWHSANPHNRLVEVFIRYVEALEPLAFLMENVQGILWTPRKGRSPTHFSVVEHLARRFASAGYIVFPKLLDAVWFGVPQYRSRFFLLALRRDLGYQSHDFGKWGPFPVPTHGPGTDQPYVTVRQAISDLPQVGNGKTESVMAYDEPGAEALKSNSFLRLMREGAPGGFIQDHVTSRHADYVIERYRRIPRGGNWHDIAAMLTNYTDATRTHSNIYRRLTWNEPSITIGHYRKSMLVHPSQHRGLSLREASRLQSFPDWFCFSGTPDGGDGGLVHKQQQLGNAVCPLVTMALAEFLLGL